MMSKFSCGSWRRPIPAFETGERKDGWRGLRLAVMCVGVSTYSAQSGLPDLDNPVRDAEAVFKETNKCVDYRAAIVRNPADKETILKRLRDDFLKPLAALPKEQMPDSVMLVLGGHGRQHGSDVFLIPAKAKSDSVADLQAECLSHLAVLKYLRDFLDSPAAKNKLKSIKFWLIMDLCRDTDASSDTHASIDAAKEQAPEHYSIYYSTSKGSFAEDGEKNSHSPLVLGLLNDESGIFARGVSLKDGVEFACKSVKFSNNRQRPIIPGTVDELGDLILRPHEAPAKNGDIILSVDDQGFASPPSSAAESKVASREVESLEDEVETVGVGYMDMRQYTARPCIMGKLKAALLEAARAQRVAVVGQGGSGKSTLARGLLQDVVVSDKGASGVRLVFFVSGRDSGDVARGYRELMQPLSGLLGRPAPADSKETEEEVRAFVHSALRDRALKHRWVGVMDDLPSPSESALEEAGLSWLLATDAGGFPWDSGKTLVTSRFHGWKETFGGVGEVVGSFEEEEAHALLADKVEHWRDQPAGIKDVARRLAYFPLALASAAGCAKAFAFKPHEYLAELERCRSELLQVWNSRAKTAGEYPHEFFQVMHVTWQRLAEGQHAETVMELLRMLAFVDPCDIPITLFEHLRRHLPILTEHCLVTVSAAEAHVSMHALTQQVLREHLMGNASNHALAAATAQVRARMREFDPDKHGTFAAGRRFAPHAKAVLSHADAPASKDVARLAYQLESFHLKVAFAFADARRMLERSLSVWHALGTPEESLEVASCYFALGALSYEQGRIAEAGTHYERSLAIYIKVRGTEEHPDVAASLNGLGTVLQKQNRLTEAATHYERSLAIYSKVHGTEEHSDVAASLNSMGTVLQKQGRIAEAATHYERSLAIKIQAHGTEEHPDVAASLHNIGMMLDQRGRYAEAVTHYERSLAIRLKAHGTEEHPSVARILGNMGTVLYQQGRIAEAAMHYERSLAIYIKVHGTEEVAGSLHNMGMMLVDQGRLAEAATHYELSLAIRLKVHGTEEHPEVADSLGSIGNVLRKQGWLAEAATHHERSLAIRLKVHGTEEHPDVANILVDMGTVLQAQGRYKEAISHYERSLAIYIKVHGTEEHPNVAFSLNHMGTVLQAQGRYKEAGTHYERSLAIYIKVHGTEEHPDVARILSNLGTLLRKQGRIAEAATHYERSLAIRLKAHGTEEHPDVARSLVNMGIVLHQQGRIAEAITYYERSLAIRLKVHDTEEHSDVACSLMNMGNVLYQQGRIAEAATHYERSLAIYIKVHGTEEHSDVVACLGNIVARSLSNLGTLLRKQGRIAEAVSNYERSLAIFIKVHGTEEHSDVADILSSLGDVLWKQGRYAEAATHYERSLAIRFKVHGTEEHPKVAISLCNIGMVLKSQFRLSEAATHYERSLAIRLKVHDTEEHPDIAALLNRLGKVLKAQGRYSEARTHYERSLAIYIKVHGTEEHPDVARTRRNLQRLRLAQ